MTTGEEFNSSGFHASKAAVSALLVSHTIANFVSCFLLQGPDMDLLEPTAEDNLNEEKHMGENTSMLIIAKSSSSVGENHLMSSPIDVSFSI